MTTIHILVAEDDDNIRMGLVDILESESYRVTPAEDGEKAMAAFQDKEIDLVLLDIMMPEKSGFDVCREIRTMDRQVPIIMLTARGEEMDKVIGLHSGADDYITKPFGIHELLARITAVLRRSGLQKEKNSDTSKDTGISDKFEFIFGHCRVNPETFKLVPASKQPPIEVDITERELKLIQFFHQHPGQVLSRDTLLNEIWGISYLGTTRTLDQHIAKLRKKIEATPSTPEIITTVHGIGYRYNHKTE